MDEVRVLAWGVVFVVFAYVVARSISFAYFRTKYEHLRKVMRELKEGED